MMKRYLAGLAAAVALACACGLAGIGAISHAAAAAGPAQESMVQGVTVSVTPPDFAATDWDFAVSLQTHVRDLGDDLRKSARLVVDGTQYSPLAWSGDPPGGHHRKGALHFKAIVPRPASVELQIRLAGESAPRSFRWQLK